MTQGHELATADILAEAERLGWPSVRFSEIGSASLQRADGLRGEKDWRSFARWADGSQIRNVRSMMANNPGVFRSPIAESTSAEEAYGKAAVGGGR